MTTVLTVALVVLLAAVIIVLVTGVVVMGRGGEANKRYGNKLMRLRVGLQLAAVVVLVLLFFVDRGAGA